MYEMNEYATAQRVARRGQTLRDRRLLISALAAVLVPLVLITMAWTGRSDPTGADAPVSAIGTATATATATSTPTPTPTVTADASPATPADPPRAAPADPDPAVPEDPEDPDPDPEDLEVLVVDPAVVLPSIKPAVGGVGTISCPDDVTMTGTIEVNALASWYPMTLKYRWVGSGEYVSQTYPESFLQNSVKQVSIERPVSASGWVALEVLSPIPATSLKVEYHCM